MNTTDKTVFLIADLAGYTALTEAHGDMSAARIVKRYVEIVNDNIFPGTKLVERVGDEILMVSNDATSIVRTAVNLRDTIENEQHFPCIHAGIHVGSALEKEGHYFGKALNLASRIAAYARGGEILCTEKIVHMAGDIEDVTYRSLGSIGFKHIPEPVAVFEVIVGGRVGECTIFDPVCHMHVQPETAVAQLRVNERVYYFCSIECAKAFSNNPDPYLNH